MIDDKDFDAMEFSDTASITSPCRAEQMGMLLALIPFEEHESFKTVDVGCGDGKFAECVLTLFPTSTIIALDRSNVMRKMAHERLCKFAGRAQVLPFEVDTDLNPGALYHQEIWSPHLANTNLVIASHFDLWAGGQEVLLETLLRSLSERAAILVAELGDAETPEAMEAYLTEWLKLIHSNACRPDDVEIVERWSRNLLEYYSDWRSYRYRRGATDGTGSLFRALKFLSEHGLDSVDCFWRRAGHTVYGGMRNVHKTCSVGRYERAMDLAYSIFAAA